MPKFEEFEKKLIDFIAINDSYDANLMNFLDSYLTQLNIEVDKRTKNVVLLLNTQQQSEVLLQELINTTQLRILKAVSLVNYLETERLILTFEPFNRGPQVVNFGQVPIGDTNANYNFRDERVGELLANYFDKQLVATPALKELVNNKYQTTEERRFNKQHRATWAGIIIAFLVGVSSLWISYNSSNIQTNNFSNFNNELNNSLESLKIEVQRSNEKLEIIYEKLSIETIDSSSTKR